MSDLEQKIEALKAQAAEICEEHNVSFLGVFQNPIKNYERVIVEGVDCTTPNGSFSSLSFNNLSTTNNEFQHVISNLLNSNKIETSSPKHHDVLSDLSSLGSILSTSSQSGVMSLEKYKMVYVDPHNKVDVKNFLYNCFEEFQQIPCKLLAKAWIKVVEPKKQSKYPYKNGESSRPFWWPPRCIHREPDHLKKDERISLLIRIIRVFKQRKTELVYIASMINGLGPNKSNDAKSSFINDDFFSKRKMDLLSDMFTVVESENDVDIKKIKVIKPGKKYSSQVYQHNKIQDSKNYSKITSTSNKSPARDGPLNFPNFSTPPSVRDTLSLKDDPIKLLPPLKFGNLSSSNESYNMFMDYNPPKISIGKQISTYNILSSPYTPSKNISMKYPTPQYTNLKFLQSSHEFSKSEKLVQNPLVNQTQNSVIDPKFYETTPLCVKRDLTPPQSIFKPLSFSESPPSGTLTISKGTSSGNTLSALSPSRMNVLNTITTEPKKVPSKRYLYTTFAINENAEKTVKWEKKTESVIELDHE